MKGSVGALGIAIVIAGGVAIWSGVFDREPESTGAALVEVAVPELSPAAETGKTIYDAKCGSCHGANGAGVDGKGPPLVHKIYEPGHHGDASFVVAIRRGVSQHHWPFGNMKPVDGVSDADLRGIIAYVREVQRANGI